MSSISEVLSQSSISGESIQNSFIHFAKRTFFGDKLDHIVLEREGDVLSIRGSSAGALEGSATGSSFDITTNFGGDGVNGDIAFKDISGVIVAKVERGQDVPVPSVHFTGNHHPLVSVLDHGNLETIVVHHQVLTDKQIWQL